MRQSCFLIVDIRNKINLSQQRCILKDRRKGGGGGGGERGIEIVHLFYHTGLPTTILPWARPKNQRIKDSCNISSLKPVTLHKSCISVVEELHKVLRKLLVFWDFLGGWICFHKAFTAPWFSFCYLCQVYRLFTDLPMTIAHFLLARVQVLAGPPWTHCCLTGSCLFLSPSPLLQKIKE